MVNTFSAEELIRDAERAYKSKNYLAAANSYRAAAHSYAQTNERLPEAEQLNNASVAYLQAKQPGIALEVTLGTDRVFAEAGDKRRQAIALGNQGAAYDAMGRLEEAARAYQESSKLLTVINDQELKPVVIQSLSAVQLRQGKQMEALATMGAGLDQLEHPGLKQRLIRKMLRSPFNLFNR